MNEKIEIFRGRKTGQGEEIWLRVENVRRVSVKMLHSSEATLDLREKTVPFQIGAN